MFPYVPTSQLIADVRRLGMIPDSATQGNQDSDILRYADLEFAGVLQPLITSVNQEYFTQTIDVTVTNQLSQYRMPQRSLAAKLRNLNYLQGAITYPVPRFEIEDLVNFVINQRGAIPAGFYLKAGSVNLVPGPGGGVLRMQYYARHGQFALWDGTTTSATVPCRITTVTYSTTNVPNDTLTLTFTGTAFTLNTFYDVIADSTPFEPLAIHMKCTATGAGTATLVAGWAPPNVPELYPSTVSPNIAPGCICVQEENMPVVPVPQDIYMLLVHRVVIDVLQSLGDTERVAAAEQTYATRSAALLQLYTPRVDGSPSKVLGVFGKLGNGSRGGGFNIGR